ncbi:hypothetical protein [Actinoplanes subtropicus]|uniref:hypothetical protein n=1 Tax=Actinoplanes subtropicus TaxID=543632 RepID=UPI0004C2D693|nr:hypothetical protein [Actinoplanes subtropicus]
MTTTLTSTSQTMRRWEMLAGTVLVLGVLVATLHVVAAVVLVASGTSWDAIDRADIVALQLVALSWLLWTKPILRSFGDDASGLTRHWAFQLSWALVLIDVVISGLGRVVLVSSVRWAASLAASLFGLVKVREVVRGVVSGEIAPYTEDPALLPPIVSGPTVRYDASPETTGLPSADDSFWSTVAVAARTSPGAALLETTPILDRRWLDLPADGNVTAVRAGVPAGATVTLWTAASAADGKQPAAPEYYGLLQATPDGPAPLPARARQPRGGLRRRSRQQPPCRSLRGRRPGVPHRPPAVAAGTGLSSSIAGVR